MNFHATNIFSNNIECRIFVERNIPANLTLSRSKTRPFRIRRFRFLFSINIDICPDLIFQYVALCHLSRDRSKVSNVIYRSEMERAVMSNFSLAPFSRESGNLLETIGSSDY